MGKGKRERYTVKQVEDALRAGAGMPAVAAAKLGCCRKTVYDYMNRHPKLWDVTHHERETFVDLAEAALKKAVLSGELGAICFTLKTLGKRRGYIERQELVTEHKERQVGVIYDGDFYGNASRFNALPAASSTPGPNGRGQVQGGRGRSPGGENGDGADGNGDGARPG